MAGGFFIAVCVALYAYEYGNLPETAISVKWLFYARDVRGGLGERRLFRACMVPLAKEFSEYVAPVVALVPEYGRWDDLWCLLDTPVCDCVTGLVKE